MKDIITEKQQQIVKLKAEAYDLFAQFEYYQLEANKIKAVIDTKNTAIRKLGEEIHVLEAQQNHNSDVVLAKLEELKKSTM